MPRTDHTDPTRNPEHPNLPAAYSPIPAGGPKSSGRPIAKELLTRIVRDAVAIDWVENPEAADICHDTVVLARTVLPGGDDDHPLFA